MPFTIYISMPTMIKRIIFLFAILITTTGYSQNSFKAEIKDAETNTPLFGANVSIEGTSLGATANEEGYVLINNIPDGEQVIRISFLGFMTRELQVVFPDDEVYGIFLQPSGEEMEEVIIAATRSRRTIMDLPTRVEVISGEELEEKGNMKPGDIRMLLNETTGIQTQQTSATSYNSSIRYRGWTGNIHSC